MTPQKLKVDQLMGRTPSNEESSAVDTKTSKKTEKKETERLVNYELV